MTLRVSCVVPYCRRTTARNVGAEWICGDHWRSIPKAWRRVYGRYARRWRRYGAPFRDPAWDRVWSAMKRKAIEIAMGISA